MAGWLQGVSNAFGGAARLFGIGSAALAPISGDTLQEILGPPRQPNIVRDQIASDIVMMPYRGPLDLDRYGSENPKMRWQYRNQYRTHPITRGALLTKSDAISCSDVAVLPGDKHHPLADEIAEFVDWTIRDSDGGWVKLFDDVYSPGPIDGYSVCTKKLRQVKWAGRTVWGFDHTRQLDTDFIRLQLDVYRNPVAVVNLVRGLEYYSPEEVILYTHNGQYGNPFGQSDLRSTTRSANMMEDAFKAWYTAVKVYGLPYMVGKAGSPTQKEALSQALHALRENGYLVIDKADELDTLNLAASAGTGMFKDLIQSLTEQMYIGIRGAVLPFQEGKGGNDAHGDSGVQKIATDAIEYHDTLWLCQTIRSQLFRWLVVPNYGPDAPIPFLKLGGTNWEETGKIVDVIAKAKKEVGYKPSAEQFADITGLVSARTEDDELRGADIQVVQAVAAIQAQVKAGQIDRSAAVENLVMFYQLERQAALRLIPEVQQPAQPGPPGAAGQPGAAGNGAADPAAGQGGGGLAQLVQQATGAGQKEATPATERPTQTFSAEHRPGWEAVADRWAAEFRGKA